MRAAMLHENGLKTWALVFDKGDELMVTLTSFARRERMGAAHFTAIGAFSEVMLGYFDRERREYTRIPVREQVEVLTLAGDIALEKGDPKVHAHVVVGKADGSAHGGHVLERSGMADPRARAHRIPSSPRETQRSRDRPGAHRHRRPTRVLSGDRSSRGAAMSPTQTHRTLCLPVSLSNSPQASCRHGAPDGGHLTSETGDRKLCEAGSGLEYLTVPQWRTAGLELLRAACEATEATTSIRLRHDPVR